MEKIINKIKDSDKIVKYITCHVPYRNCNLRCSYCYIGQVRSFHNDVLKLPSPEFVRNALSRKRLGGTALINLCAGGETLLCTELLPIICELVEEGHYISIVTNGTVAKAFDWLLKSGIDLKHLFIKFSFHYSELKRLGMLKKFAQTVNRVWDAGLSFTVELMADDTMENDIPEIKKFSVKHFGALPHCLIPRDDTSDALDVRTDLPLKQYYRLWSKAFRSEMFDFKRQIIGERRTEDCMAGLWSFQMDLKTGDICKCVKGKYLDNIYEDLDRPIHLEKTGRECKLPYCYNGHAYLCLGLIDGFEAPLYYDVRNRNTADGRSWVIDDVKNIFKQKLCVNNKSDNSE